LAKLSVIVPARNELFLGKTVDDLLAKARGDVQVIVILDGFWPKPMPKEDPRLIIVHREKRGMRASINAGVAIAKGEIIMKVDAHVMFSEGYDVALTAECDKDWIVIPRRYSLEVETEPWDVRRHRPFVDYEYLSWPWRPDVRIERENGFGLHGWTWDERIASRINVLLDETMTFQGSCWVMHREYFNRRIGVLSNEGYGTFIGEAQEIGLKAWLGGGKVMVNKKVWYGHLWKGQPYRDRYRATYGIPYTRLGRTERDEGNRYSVDYWINNRWPERIHDIEWLVDRFWPVPSWPKDRSKWIPSITTQASNTSKQNTALTLPDQALLKSPT
jgi:glycosyltransferase involved in cell wall biosynthesis